MRWFIALLLILPACRISTNTKRGVKMALSSVDTTQLNIDNTLHSITLAPMPDGGDNYPQLQWAINRSQTQAGWKIFLTAGNYPIYSPLIVYARNGADYGQSYVWLEGPSDAINTPSCATIQDFSNVFALGIQQGKGCTIKNIQFIGGYTRSYSFSPLQIDTLPPALWQDSIHSFNRSSPYAAIVIDPFSDPQYYDSAAGTQMYRGLSSFYLPGMSPAGSTAITITGCGIYEFVVGVMVTPSHQANAEMINFTHSQITGNAFGYAFSQSQSKVNLVSDIMDWGGTYCIFDGVRFGIAGGDGAICPMIDGMNIAGFNHEFIEHYAAAFPVTIKRIYAEGLFMIGYLNAPMGADLQDWQIDFPQQHGQPSPGVVLTGNNITFNADAFRVYNGSSLYNRLCLFGYNMTFNNGIFGCPPAMGNIVDGQIAVPGYPVFNRVLDYYCGTSMDGTDTWDHITALGYRQVHYNPDFTGYVIGADTTQLSPNDLIVAPAYAKSYYSTWVDNYCIGYVDHFHGDTTFLAVMGYGLTNDSSYIIYLDKMQFAAK